MKKIDYKNISFPNETTVYYPDTDTPEGIKDSIFHECHRYHGNNMEGGGRAQYSVYQVNVKKHDDIKRDINRYETQITKLQKDILHYLEKIKRLNEDLKTEYVEEFLYTEKIGGLRTDEELLNEGFSVNQIKNRKAI